MSGLLERQKALVTKYGFTLKAYWVGFVVMPPVAILIALNLRSLALGWRIALCMLVVLAQVALLSGGASLLVALFRRLSALF